MKFEKTSLDEVWLIKPKIFEDDRGHFLESFRKEIFKEKGVEYEFLQDNISTSTRGTIRGLHYQISPFSQAKLVMAVYGEILDVAVDIRKGSATFGQYFSSILNDTNRHMMLVPSGFAHGFSVLSEKATVAYKCDQYYNKESERGVRWNDPVLGIDWKTESAILSEKDKNQPLLKNIQEKDLFKLT
ncbi:MAG: dTDP-4-dehydrorhamnose 3,5-epimerase [Balneolaceae bacterium]|nr:dTDP-4-dehydrorhamnose 3,5-epimerase [Balneolaceae bacterium]MDR9409185.1 dTDP-4-dehydrorhamnose 3,5-epimerase [Balneolaceae bacterium]